MKRQLGAPPLPIEQRLTARASRRTRRQHELVVKPAAYESHLAYHNIGGTPDERKQLAKHLFDTIR